VYQQNRAMKKNKEWWNERFDKTNQYNSPVQQTARMREAGLNPAMMYGGGQGGGTAQSPSTGDYQAPESNVDQLSLISSQVENLKKDSQLKGAQKLTEGYKAATENANSQIKQDLANTSADLFKFELGIKKQELYQSQIETTFKTMKEKTAIWESLNRIEKLKTDMAFSRANKKFIDQKTKTEFEATIIKKEEARLAADGVFLNQNKYSVYKELATKIFGVGDNSGTLLDTPDANLTEKQKLKKRLQQTTVNQGKYADFGPKF
jgi:hypothetical protein